MVTAEDSSKEQSTKFSQKIPRKVRKCMDGIVDELTRSKKGKTKFELADELNVPPQMVDVALNTLRRGGQYLIERVDNSRSGDVLFKLSTHLRPAEEHVFGSEYFPGGVVRFAAISNTRFGNKYHRDDALHAFYDVLGREGINLVLHCGDILEGVITATTRDEVLFPGPEFQTQNLIKNYPKVDGIDTYFITAKDAEGSFTRRPYFLNIGRFIEDSAIEAGRDDLHYLGPHEADTRMSVGGRDVVVRLAHPTIGIPYAASYRPQKMAESIQGGTKPHVMLVGHTGNIETIFVKDIWVAQVGGFIDQTPSMRNAQRGTSVGGYIIELRRPQEFTLPNGTVSYEERFQEDQVAFIPEALAFFNRGFYDEKGKAPYLKGKGKR